MLSEEELSKLVASPLSVTLGLFMLVSFIWIASSVASFFTTPFRQIIGIKRPFIRRLFAYIFSLMAEQLDNVGRT